MTIVFYTSGHGFGHAARDLEVIAAIRKLAPESRLVLRTSVPHWFIVDAGVPSLEIQECETDTGVVQAGGLAIDEHETARRAATFYGSLAGRVDAEAVILDR